MVLYYKKLLNYKIIILFNQQVWKSYRQYKIRLQIKMTKGEISHHNPSLRSRPRTYILYVYIILKNKYFLNNH